MHHGPSYNPPSRKLPQSVNVLGKERLWSGEIEDLKFLRLSKVRYQQREEQEASAIWKPLGQSVEFGHRDTSCSGTRFGTIRDDTLMTHAAFRLSVS